MIGRHQAAVESNELLFAQLTQVTMKYSMRGPKEVPEIKDFMPSEWRKDKVVSAAKRCRMTLKHRAVVASKIRERMRGFGSRLIIIDPSSPEGGSAAQ